MNDVVLEDDNAYFSDETATFGDRVAAGRETLGMNQSSLSRKLGIKTKTLQAWENDMSEPRANKLQMLAGVLNVSIIWLLTGVGEGLDEPPVEMTEEVAETGALLAEMRNIRGAYGQLNERLARLEKRLRNTLK